MRILYGVTGEGMGHATRSAVILDHLVRDHEVQIVVSGRAHDFLKRRFMDVHEIEGLTMAYDGSGVDRSRTFWELVRRLPDMLQTNYERFIGIGERFAPEVVVSDFESFAYTFGKQHELPVISIDNMQVLNRCELEEVLDDERDRVDFHTAKAIVKAKLPGCYHYLVTSFFFPPVRKPRTSLHPPILRQAILDAEVTTGDHLLVYQTTTADERLLSVLADAGVEARVYGTGREGKQGKLELEGFSEDGFIADLASCRGVLATGGFSLMGEAVYLGKPLLAVPLRRQFEQRLNALYLAKLGYGECHDELTVESVRAFCAGLDRYAESLAGHRQQGNREILAALDRLLGEIAAAERERRAD